MKPKWWPYSWLLAELLVGAILCAAIVVAHDVDIISLSQITYYSILATALALAIGGIGEWRLEDMRKQLDGLLAKRSNLGCPRGHIWPVDGCPFCRRDSRYL
ncbi:hypothetical protein AUF78_09320 [archaeon 13_1_20CM_2_51_12]|nr:MAG: hypothetical protein AUF78_09320 [archaeon 13_1_20CM_2_51_12]